MRLGKQPVKRWSSLRELELLKGHKGLLLPTNKNQAGLDGFFWDEEAGHHVPFDCTVASSHGIHMTKLREALHAVGWDPIMGWPSSKTRVVEYFWLVPEGVFGSQEAFTKAQAAKRDASDPEVAACLEQYTLCFGTDLIRDITVPVERAVPPPDEDDCEV